MAERAQEFDRLLESYYRAWFRFHPEAAVDAGVAGYADRLTPYDDDEIGALQALHEKLLAGLEEHDCDGLDPDRCLDARLVHGAALIEHHALLEQDWRRRDPARFLPVNAIYQLTVRPVDDLVAALSARLAAIPAYLRGARGHLSQMPELIPPLWLETAVAEARAGAQYLHDLPAHPRVAHAFPNPARVAGLADQAAQALAEFARFLEQEIGPHAQGTCACGREHFERLLAHRHFLDVDADELHAFGRRLYEETLRDLKDAARALGGEDVATLTARIRADHPSAAELLPAYRAQMEAARRFVAEHDLVTVPARQVLKVVETPLFMRHRIPFAAYLEPAPNDPEQCGHYYVTPAESEELLGEHDHAGLAHTCVHEAWPGHHLQFVTAHLNPAARTLPRLLNSSATLYEGWALYCEQLMHERGFLNRPEQRFILLRDRLWRALRVLLDVELHTRGLSVEQAVAHLQQALGFPRPQALAELAWYTRAPTVPMGYATGWALIGAARERLRIAAPDFDLKAFHDRLLCGGSIALALLLQRHFGPELWHSARAMVFADPVADEP